MDAQQALADLTEISSQIQAAVVFDEKGKLAGSTLRDSGRADELAKAATELLSAADDIRAGDSPLAQLEVATSEGSVFVVRDGKTCIAATTGGNPTVGLVFYDLKSALRNVKPAAKRSVRVSGPEEGVRGNREVPPTKKRESKKATAAPTAKKKTAARKPATRKKTDAS